jgi:hypothetical protein
VIRNLFRDERVLSEVLRCKLLRSAIRAVGTLNSGGRASQDEYRAATALIRIASRFVQAYDSDRRGSGGGDDDRSVWDAATLIKWEQFTRVGTREEYGRTWLQTFDKYGPIEGKYETRQEAIDYGRWRWDHYFENNPDNHEGLRPDSGEGEPRVY